jgi:hypothetical protein
VVAEQGYRRSGFRKQVEELIEKDLTRFALGIGVLCVEPVDGDQLSRLFSAKYDQGERSG